ncbi:hypothetical protein Leryth_002532 [Lithospermum erythrorhizon]|nr:hypothetical protein Leryth_002532 [Lithospermum erythrorhizon]
MTDYEDNAAGSPLPPPHTPSGSAAASQHYSDYEKDRESSKSRERTSEKQRDSERSRDKEKDRRREKSKDSYRDSDKERDKDRDRDREKGHDHHRSRHRERSERRERERTKDRDDDDHHKSRHSRRDYDSDREERHGHRSRSRSMGKSEHRSRSPSRSHSKRRISGFDMAPPASALIPAVVAATASVTATASGQVSGAAPAFPGLFPSMLPLSGQFGTLPVMPVQAMTQQATRHARRVYVGGLSPSANEQAVSTFFSHVMLAIGGNTAGPGDSVVNVYINHDKKFAFVEMRSVEEASNAMALDGIIFEGAPVKVRRPTDYNPALAATLGPSQPNPNLNLAAVGLAPGSTGVLEGPDRIFVGGVPYYFTDAQIRELLESFGSLKGFNLVKDRETGNSKGYAFCVYQDTSVTDIACAALNGIKLGDKTLTVRRANQGTIEPKPEQESILLHAQQQIALQKLLLQPAALLATKVLCLTQVVQPEELMEDEDYEDILEDMKVECGKFGTLVNVVIPRPNSTGEPTPGVGKVFLEYADVESSSKARQGLNGRKFGGNQVVAVFYPENKFAQREYDG